jgi:urea ABC transporter substrate-binding protein
MIWTRRRLLRAGSLAAAARFANPPGAYAATPIRVGSLLDLSGPIGSTGQPMFDAIRLAVDEVNGAGGLLGRKINLINYDTQSTIALYSQYAQRLALQDRVDVVHGGITSASREAIRPVFDRYRVLYVYNVLYEGGVCDLDCYCTGTTPAQTVSKLVEYALKTWGKKVYIIAADYNYGQITAKWMAKYARDGGGEVQAVEFFPLDVTSFTASISKIETAKPDVLLSALVGSNHTAFYRQWAAAGMKAKIPIASTTFGLVNELATLDPATSDGIVTGYGYFQELPTPENAGFVGAIHKKFGADVPYIGEPAATTYEGFHLWAEGVRKAGSLDRAKVIKALDGGVSVTGPSGQVAIDPGSHQTVRNAYLGKAVGRKWQVIATFPHQEPADTQAVCDLLKNPRTDKQFVINVKS